MRYGQRFVERFTCQTVVEPKSQADTELFLQKLIGFQQLAKGLEQQPSHAAPA